MKNGKTQRLTRIKVCGFTRVADAQIASELGVDAVGLVFYPPSPRHVGIEQAVAIATAVSPFCTVTALFLDAEVSYVEEVLSLSLIHI